MSSRPPTAVRPEMALVTLMRGLCRAGVTPQTVWYPQMLASPNLVTVELKTAPGEAAPRAMMAPNPPVVTRALFRVGLYRSTGPTGSAFFSFLGGGGADCSIHSKGGVWLVQVVVMTDRGHSCSCGAVKVRGLVRTCNSGCGIIDSTLWKLLVNGSESGMLAG